MIVGILEHGQRRCELNGRLAHTLPRRRAAVLRGAVGGQALRRQLAANAACYQRLQTAPILANPATDLDRPRLRRYLTAR